jgi:glycosyltransferase involved in cell wall biosynthesis
MKKRKPKVLLLLWHPDNTIAGGFVRIKEFLPYLSENFDITILDNNPSILKDFKDLEIVEYKIPSLIRVFYNFSFALGRLFEWTYVLYALSYLGAKLLSKRKFDIIYGPTGDNLHIFLSAVFLKKIFPKTKLLLDILNLEMPEGGINNYYQNFRRSNFGILDSAIRTHFLAFLLLVERKLIRNCDYVVTVSPYMKKIISKYYPQKRIEFTPSGVAIPKNLKFNKKRDINVFIGRHTKDKGVFDLLKVWQKVVSKNSGMKIVTAGPVEESVRKILEENIKEDGLGNNFKLEGFVSEERKWELLCKSKCFLHLAYFEPLVPVISILEALACGVPVVLYETPAIDDYPFLRTNEAVHIVGNKDIAAAAEKVAYLNSVSQDKFDKIAHEARFLAKKFSWEEISKKEIRVFNKLVNEK